MDAKRLGNAGEEFAAAALEAEGYEIAARQYRTRYGELDLVAKKGDQLLFVEVKTRSTDFAGRPASFVSRQKRNQMMADASRYIASTGGWDGEIRFEVFEICCQRTAF